MLIYSKDFNIKDTKSMRNPPSPLYPSHSFLYIHTKYPMEMCVSYSFMDIFMMCRFLPKNMVCFHSYSSHFWFLVAFKFHHIVFSHSGVREVKSIPRQFVFAVVIEKPDFLLYFSLQFLNIEKLKSRTSWNIFKDEISIEPLNVNKLLEMSHRLLVE